MNKTPETDKNKFFTTVNGGCVVEVVGVSLCEKIEADRNRLIDVIKETTNQMHNEGNGEYTLPAWFARSLYEYISVT